jgi:DNA-directed RNA polymerase specialized sigma24 family protein
MDKDDIYQECALHLFIKKEEFDPNKAVFCAWADKVANNYINNLIRNSKTKKASYLNNASDLDDEIEKEGLDL